MKKNYKRVLFWLMICFLMVTILDTQTLIVNALSAIQLCIQSIIPSLLPIIAISSILNSLMSGQQNVFLNALTRLFRLPEGAGSLFFFGFLGGYPLGAKTVAEYFRNGSISYTEARRLLSYISNAGPAFIFGIVGSIFNSTYIVWIIWAIHIVSALFVAWIIPKIESTYLDNVRKPEISVNSIAENTVKTMGVICFWIIITRVLIGYLKKWVLWRFSNPLQILTIGFLELTNGIIEAQSSTNEAFQFVAVCTLLSFGGFCVVLQTLSIIKELGISTYFKGKILQSVFSFMLSSVISGFIFQQKHGIPFYWIILILFVGFGIIYSLKKNCSSEIRNNHVQYT